VATPAVAVAVGTEGRSAQDMHAPAIQP
jgi:hypothetical protein